LLTKKTKIVVPISKSKVKGSLSLVPPKVIRKMMTKLRKRKIKKIILRLK